MTLNTRGNAVAVESLSKRFGRIEALRGVSLTVREGEIFGLLGSNGAGKTTLIKAIVGSSRPNSGTVSVLGLDPIRQAGTLRRQIGYMPQAPALYEDLSARDNVRFFGQAHGLENLERRIDEVLDFIKLRDRQGDAVYGFSGGMKQRVSLACALIHRPRLLLLDEPTAGVDPRLRESLWKHFRELAAGGATLLVSTHQMDEALYCDRLAIMRDGVLLACDSPRNLLRSGRATIKVWHGEQVETETVTSYPENLPRLLARHHLDPAVTRIEISEDTLETIVLGLINARESQPPQESQNATRG